MALIDDPTSWILRLFEMEEHEGRGTDCVRFPEGTRPAELPLDDGESVLGIYKSKYHFTPRSLIIVDGNKAERIPWADVRSCSSEHGEGKTYSNLMMADGRAIRVRVGDMAKGWSGRISQLYHQMIERYGQRPAMGRPLMSTQEFFAYVTDGYSVAPNLEPHPSLEALRVALLELERLGDGTEVLMDLVAENDELVADAIVVVTTSPKEHFERFVRAFRADGVYAADERTIRKVGQVPEGFNVWHIIWD